MKPINSGYNFINFDTCNMCGAPASRHKVMGLRLNKSQGFSPLKKTGISVSVVKCRDCGLIFSNPMPVPMDIQDHYGIPPEQYWKPEYFEVNKEYFSSVIDELKEQFGMKPGAKTLDIGAGLGKAMIAMQNAGFDAYGLEPSEPFYKRAIEKMGISPDKMQLNTLENASYPQNHFDFIYFGAVLEHLHNPSESILKAMQWLKPGGIIKIAVPSSSWLTAKIINTVYRMKFSPYVCNISPMHEPFHLFEFTLKSFQKHAKLHNYKVVKHEYEVCSTFMPKILNPILVPLMKFTNTGMQVCVWLGKA
jgi:SAM-dependent methyltransferase